MSTQYVWSLVLELYKVTKEERYKELGLIYADTQWEVPANAKPKEKECTDKGYSWQTRLWIDDMYMVPILKARFIAWPKHYEVPW